MVQKVDRTGSVRLHCPALWAAAAESDPRKRRATALIGNTAERPLPAKRADGLTDLEGGEASIAYAIDPNDGFVMHMSVVSSNCLPFLRQQLFTATTNALSWASCRPRS